MPLTDEQRAENFQKMQARITAAQRVQRRLKSGPRMRNLPDSLSMVDAVGRLTVEADRARTAMHAEQLDPNDAHIGLIFTVAAQSQESIGVKWLPPAARLSEFIAAFEKMAKHSTLAFIGIVCGLLDREANTARMWAKPSPAGQEEKMQLARQLFQVPNRVN